MPMNIGGRVKQRMDELGLTVPDVVERVPGGVVSSQALWALIKRDSVRSEFDVILAKTLGVSPIWLVYGDEGVADPVFYCYAPAPEGVARNVHQFSKNNYANSTIEKTSNLMARMNSENQARVYGYACGLEDVHTVATQTNKAQ